MRRFLLVGLATFFLGACMPLLASGLDLERLSYDCAPQYQNGVDLIKQYEKQQEEEKRSLKEKEEEELKKLALYIKNAESVQKNKEIAEKKKSRYECKYLCAVGILFSLTALFFFLAVRRNKNGEKFGGVIFTSRVFACATASGLMNYARIKGVDIDPIAYVAVLAFSFYMMRPLVLMLGNRSIVYETVPCSSKNTKKNKWVKYIIMLVAGVVTSNLTNHYYFGNLTNLGCCIFGTIFGISFWFVMLFLIDSIKKANIAYKQDNPNRALSYSALCVLVFAAWVFALFVAYSILPNMHGYYD